MSGLGIDLGLESIHRPMTSSPKPVPSLPRSLLPCDKDSGNKDGTSVASHLDIPALRSRTAMRGLLLAEVGDATVEFDTCEGSSGFREGRRIILGHVTPGGGSKSERPTSRLTEASLARNRTLLTVGAAPGRNAAELKSFLGNSNARLKPGAAVLPYPGDRLGGRDSLLFEQAKARPRVEVDIVLESDICVQGGYLQGHVEIRIRKPSKDESPILLAGGKVRVVGFECIPNTNDRHTFYHCAAPLSSIAVPPLQFWATEPDADGFSEAKEGSHILPFVMQLPAEGDSMAKGVFHAHSGVKVRYIAMVYVSVYFVILYQLKLRSSIKVKDNDTDKKSIAHFYRNCEVWPRLNPSVILAPAPTPLQASTSKSLFMGGNGKLRLTATLHRLHWIAGQQCCIQVSVKNDTKKTVKSLTLTLIRTTVIFRPRPQLDALPPTHDHSTDPDACQTSTTQKQIAETTLEMGSRCTRGRVSAKGWWTGITPGESLRFSHFLSLPVSVPL